MNASVLAASKLAAFFVASLEHEPAPIPPTLRPVVIHCSELDNAFFVENAEKTMIYWPQPPASETPGRRTGPQRPAGTRPPQVDPDPHPPDPVPYPFYLDFTEGRSRRQAGDGTHTLKVDPRKPGRSGRIGLLTVPLG